MSLEVLVVMILGVLAKVAPTIVQAFVGDGRTVREALAAARAAIPPPSSPEARADYDAALDEIRAITPEVEAEDLERAGAEKGPVASARELVKNEAALERLASRAKLLPDERELLGHAVVVARSLARPSAKKPRAEAPSKA